jgi:primosomal protein N' (replication factor Y)
MKTRGKVIKDLKIYDPVPKPVMRVAGAERSQLLLESVNRKSLQEALEIIDQELREHSQGRISKTSRVRWLIERDPIAI